MSEHRLAELIEKGSKCQLSETEMMDLLPLYLLTVDTQRDDIYTVHQTLGVEQYVWIDFLIFNIEIASKIRMSFGMEVGKLNGVFSG